LRLTPPQRAVDRARYLRRSAARAILRESISFPGGAPSDATGRNSTSPADCGGRVFCGDLPPQFSGEGVPHCAFGDRLGNDSPMRDRGGKVSRGYLSPSFGSMAAGCRPATGRCGPWPACVKGAQSGRRADAAAADAPSTHTASARRRPRMRSARTACGSSAPARPTGRVSNPSRSCRAGESSSRSSIQIGHEAACVASSGVMPCLGAEGGRSRGVRGQRVPDELRPSLVLAGSAGIQPSPACSWQ
jgi:hypothetical protein